MNNVRWGDMCCPFIPASAQVPKGKGTRCALRPDRMASTGMTIVRKRRSPRLALKPEVQQLDTESASLLELLV